MSQVEDQVIAIKMEMLVGYDQFEEVIVTALEGGSNYWYLIDEKHIPPKEKYPMLAPSQRVARAVWEGAVIPVHDAEDPETVLGDLSIENFKNNFASFIHEWVQIEDQSGDAETADIILQFTVMGELTFG